MLYWVLKDTRWADLVGAVRHVDLPLFLLSTLLVTLTFPARAMRTRWLLRAATGRRPPYLPVWRATAIGFMANNLLPLRAGELARGVALGRLLKERISTALSTIAVERVFDGIVIMLLLAVAVASPEFPVSAAQGERLGRLAAVTATIFASALGILALVAHYPDRILRPVHAAVRRTFSEHNAARVLRIIDGLADGVGVLRRGGDFAWVLGWTLALWGLNAASYVAAFEAFHLGVPASTSLVLQGVLAIGVSVPSTPGFVGVFEGACKLTLGFYGVAASTAAAFALAVHLAWFIPITALGLLSLARTGLTMHDIRRRAE